MTDTTWAAKVLEGVPRLDTDPMDYTALIPTEGGSLVSYDAVIAAIAKLGAGDGWFDVFKNIATEAERVATYEKTRAEAAEAEAAALRAKVAELEGVLRKIADMLDYRLPRPQDVARAALNNEDKEKP